MAVLASEPIVSNEQLESALKQARAVVKILETLETTAPAHRFRVLRAAAVMHGLDTSVPIFEAFQS